MPAAEEAAAVAAEAAAPVDAAPEAIAADAAETAEAITTMDSEGPVHRQPHERRCRVSEELLNSLAIFVLAILVGFEVISKVPATLHTPLMSGANSIHGIVLVGAMIIAAEANNPLSYVLAFVATVFGAANVVGGYVVTDRMLQMFKKKPIAAKADAAKGA